MDYTHTFEVLIDGVAIQGELLFNKNSVVCFKTEDTLETTVLCMDRIQRAFTAVFECEQAFGRLKKFVIEEK